VLLGENPFPLRPPRYIRAVLHEYHMTSLAERRLTGQWWRRERIGVYVSALSLRSTGGSPAWPLHSSGPPAQA